MKKLLITLLLISPFSFADWGDVYYCQMTYYSSVTKDGKATNNKLKKFKFTMDESKQAVVFGSDSYFSGVSMNILVDWSLSPSGEVWQSNLGYIKIRYEKGKFLFVMIDKDIDAITADCDKF